MGTETKVFKVRDCHCKIDTPLTNTGWKNKQPSILHYIEAKSLILNGSLIQRMAFKKEVKFRTF